MFAYLIVALPLADSPLLRDHTISVQLTPRLTSQVITDPTTKPWGFFEPKGVNRLPLLVAKLGLGRGSFKKCLASMFRSGGKQLPVDTYRHGIKWRLFPWDNSTDGKILFGSRQHDAVEIEMLQSVLRSGGTFLDIGANTGYYSLLAAKAGADRVLAVEPNPTMVARLKFNIAANDFNRVAQVVEFGVAPQAGTMTLYFNRKDMGACSLVAPGGEDGDKLVAATVPVATLDDILHQYAANEISAMKVDIEGMETEVLLPFFHNAPSQLHPKLLIIEHVHIVPDAPDLLNWLSTNNYEIVAKTRSNLVFKLGK